jgi:hypothetical protein
MRLILAAFLVVFGYGVAVAVASALALVSYLGIGQLPHGSGVGVAEFWRDLPVLYSGGFIVTFGFGLPGFILVLVLAWRLGWSRCLTFATAGAANAVLALFISNFQGGGMFVPSLLVSCIPAGFVGGASYWASAGRFLHFPKAALASETGRAACS